MASHPAADRANRVGRIAPWIGGFVAGSGLLVLAGWAADVALLKSLVPGLATMKPNTAAGFVLVGAALWLATHGRSRPGRRASAVGVRAVAVAVLALGALTLAEYGSGVDLGLERLLFPSAGRMALITALNFVLVGAALVLIDVRCRAFRPANWLALAVAVNSYVALLGYLYGADALYQVRPMNSVALHTAALFLVASIGIAAARPGSAFMRRLFGAGADAQINMRLLPTVILLPPVIGWVRWMGELAGLYETPFGLALFAVSNVVLFTALAWWTAGTVGKSHEHLRAILDNEPECVKVVGPDGTLLEMNTAGLRMVEADSLSQVRNQCIYPLVAEADREAFVALNREILAGGSGILEFEIVGLRGGRRWLETHAAPLRDGGGKVSAMLGITRDVTERKRAQAQLADQQRRTAEQLSELEMVYQTAPVGLALLDRQLRFVRVNERLAAINGRSVDAHLGHSLEEIVPGLSDRLLAIHRGVLDSGVPTLDVEIQGVTPADPDQPRHWVASYLPVRGVDGQVMGVSAVVTDITEHKLAEAALRESAARRRALAQRLVEVQELEQRRLSTELHDRIGQSLTALSINLNIIGGVVGDDAAASARLHDSRRLLETTIASVRDLITDLRPIVLDDYGLVAGLRWFGEQVRERSGLTVQVYGEQVLHRPEARIEDACFRIAQEALTNAVKHAVARSARIDIACAPDRLVMDISDDGIGFDARAGRSPRGDSHWGLEMMRERAEAIGAALLVTSRPGEGTRVRLEWPAPA